MNTLTLFTVQFRRTAFDNLRTMEIMAETPKEARRTTRELEGERVIIDRVLMG